MMNAITFAAQRLTQSIFLILVFIFGVVSSAAASSMITTIADNPIETFPGSMAKVENADSNFTAWSSDVMTPALESLTSELLALTLPPTCTVHSAASVHIDNFPRTILPVSHNFPVHVNAVELHVSDFSGSDDILGTSTTNAGVPQTWYDDDGILSYVPVPEPGTLVLFVTAFGLFGYGRWRRKKHGFAQTSVAVTNIPVSEQHCQEERMAMVGKMAGEVMHDVKNALTGIKTCAVVLGYEDIKPEDRLVFEQTIVGEIDRIVGMTQDLLDFSCGKRKALKLEICAVKELLQDILSVIECDFRNRNIAIYTDLHYTREIQMDVSKMKRVFMNLVYNARDAMLEGGTLTITSRLIDDAVQIEFTDTGCGMSAELQARMFEPLVTEGKPHGTGLGMTIVKDILDEHQARIGVKSAVGEGTTIRITLPLMQYDWENEEY